MGRALEMDDLNKGMFLTVLRGNVTNRLINGPEGPMAEIKEDKRLNGKVLRVTAVDLPFIAVEFFYVGDKIRSDVLDSRAVELGSLTLEYIEAAEPKWEVPVDYSMFDGSVKWTYDEFLKQPVKEAKDVQRPKSYKDNELLNSL